MVFPLTAWAYLSIINRSRPFSLIQNHLSLHRVLRLLGHQYHFSIVSQAEIRKLMESFVHYIHTWALGAAASTWACATDTGAAEKDACVNLEVGIIQSLFLPPAPFADFLRSLCVLGLLPAFGILFGEIVILAYGFCLIEEM